MGFLQDVVDTFRRAHVSFLAASIASAAFVSLLPLLVLVVMVASVVVGVILLVTWLSFGGLTVLLGATVNVVLSQGPPARAPVPA